MAELEQTMQKISLTINGKSYEFEVEPQETLVQLLRERLRLMRTKEGCGVGECGSCTVIMDKKAVASCLVLAVDADGSEIVTTEGMSCDSELQPMQEMFVDHLALQARIGVSTLSARQEYLTFCHLCCGHCAVKVTVADNVIVDMAPDFESGLSNEQCVFKKGRLSIPEIHSHPDRLLHPLKRVGARGEGKWERISWEEALDTIADKFRAIREESGPEYVTFALGEPHGLEFAFAQRFASVFGSPNVTTPGWFCGVPFQSANAFTFGQGAVPDEEGAPELLVVWGTNPNHTSGGIRRQTVIKIVESGAKIVVIDPRKIDLAGLADMWVKPRPGTDGALAMGLLKVVVEEELYDKQFVADWTIGFDELKAELGTFSLAEVAAATWVPEEQIRELARLIGTNHPTCLHWGNGIDQGVHPFQTHRAISILAAISGNLNVPGGIVLPDSDTNFVRPGKFYLLSKRRAFADKTIGKEYPMTLMSTSVPSWELVKAILEEKPYLPQGHVLHAHQSDDELHQLQGDPRSPHEDRVLGGARYLHDADGGAGRHRSPGGLRDGARRGRLLAGVVQRGEGPSKGGGPARRVLARHQGHQRAGQAAWVGGLLGRGPRGTRRLVGSQRPQLRRSQAPSDSAAQEGVQQRQPPHSLGQGGDRRRHARVAGIVLAAATGRELSAIPEIPDEYPLLFTNSKSEIFVGTSYKSVPTLRAMRPEPMVQMNPATARDLGLNDGDEVYIETKIGRAKQRLVFDPDMDPRVIFVDFGWWFPEDPYGEPWLGYGEYQHVDQRHRTYRSRRGGDGPERGSLPGI